MSKTCYITNEDGELHNVDGPAVIYTNGNKEWRVNGKLHRIYGPAVTLVDGREFYVINNVEMPKQEHQWLMLKRINDKV